MIHLTIHALPKLPNQTLYKHWRFKQVEAKKWKAMVMEQVLAWRLNEQKRAAHPFKRATVTLTRHSSREPDGDNLMSSWKHCIDGLVLAGIIENDKPSVIGTPQSLWCFAKRKEQRVEIRVEELKESA